MTPYIGSCYHLILYYYYQTKMKIIISGDVNMTLDKIGISTDDSEVSKRSGITVGNIRKFYKYLNTSDEQEYNDGHKLLTKQSIINYISHITLLGAKIL